MAPERTASEAVGRFLSSFVTISTLDATHFELCDGQSIQQTVHAKICRQSVEITVSRDSVAYPTLGTYNTVSNSSPCFNCLNTLQTGKAKTVQTRKRFGICEPAVTYGTAYMFVNVVQKGFDIHGNCGKRKLLTLNTPENEPTWQKQMLTDTVVLLNSINQNRLLLTFLSKKSQTS